jgi:acetylornithine deacetylase
MHKGILMEGVRLIGQSGHSSNPALGNSALEGMHKVVDELLAYRTELQMAHQHAAFDVPVPTLNLGHIHGGDNPNRICGECELSLDLRPLPGMKIDSLRSTIHQRVRDRLHDSGLIVEFETLFEGIPAAETDPNSEIVKAAEALTGCRAESVAFGTEAPYFQALGMEVVVLGPGDVAQAHQPDEYLALNRLAPTLDILTKLIDRFCVNSTLAA